jgi:hypothetical protein
VSPRVVTPFLPGLIALAVACAPGLAQACDSSSCLLVTRGQNGLVGKGDFRVDFTYRFTPMTELMRGSETASEVLRPKIDFENDRLLPGFHNELGGHDNFLQVDMAYGLFNRTAVFVSLPVRASRDFDIGHLPVQRETYSTVGNGDVLLGVRHAIFQRAGSSLVAGLMLELPAGKYTLEAPEDRADSGILDPMLQPGTGSFDVGAAVQYGHRLGGSWDATAATSYQVYTTNDLDFRSGADFIASFTVSRPLYGPLGGSLQLKGMHKDRSQFMGDDVPNTGGRFLYLVPGLSVRAPMKLAVYGYAVVPVYRYVNEAQLAPKTGFVLGLSRTF